MKARTNVTKMLKNIAIHIQMYYNDYGIIKENVPSVQFLYNTLLKKW